MRKKYTIELRNRKLNLGEKTLVMGILNVTTDSFSDGGKFLSKEKAVEHALKMVEDGADIIDIGAESTRPGSETVGADEEIQRVVPIIREIRKKSSIPISIDTYKSTVASESINAGADTINDISGCRFDKDMPAFAAASGTPIIVMHIKGRPKDMQTNPTYKDVIGEIRAQLCELINLLSDAGVAKEKIIIDPGIGFGKTTEHNLTIMNRLEEFSVLDRPVLIGVSRKSVIGNVLNLPANKRIFGTAATVAVNILRGAHIVRVHDVFEMKQVARMTDAINNEIYE